MLPTSQINKPYESSFENSEKKENETADPISKIGEEALQQDLPVSQDSIRTLTSAIGKLNPFSEPVPKAPPFKQKLDQINTDAEINLPLNIEDKSQRYIQKFPSLLSLDRLALRRVIADALNQQQYTPDDFMKEMSQLLNRLNPLVVGKKIHVGMTSQEASFLLSGDEAEVGCFVIHTSQENPTILIALVVLTPGSTDEYAINLSLEDLNLRIQRFPHMQKYVDTDGQLVPVPNKEAVDMKMEYNGVSYKVRFNSAGKLISKTEL